MIAREICDFAPGVDMPKISALGPLLTAAFPTVFLSGVASADLLAPGGLSEDLATSLDQRPDLGGEIEAMQYVPFSLRDDQGNSFYMGQVVHEVLREPDSTTLSFYYHFVNAPSSAVLGIDNLIAHDF